MQSGREDTVEKRYAIKLCFKLGKNDATETYGILQTAFRPFCMNRASVFEWYKRFKEGTESVRDDERCGRSMEVITPQLIGQRIRVRVTGCTGVQQEIPSEEHSTLQIGSVAFPAGQCTSPPLHPCHRLFDTGWASRRFVSLPIVQTLLPVTLGYSLSSEAVVMRQLRR